MSVASRNLDLSLSRGQEELLRAAIASNPKGSQGVTAGNMGKDQTQQLGIDTDLYTSPTLDAPGSGNLSGFDDSPFLDNELEDGQYDWDDSAENLFGDLPGSETLENEHHDKRKASADNEPAEETASKKHEAEEKTAKKPGRKPLTVEPTTKRKAQNRAAQRAFRERKERHLKDLETKVDELEKASEATNHENGRLRAQVDKLNMEVKEYRKRLSVNNTSSGVSPPLANPQARDFYNSNTFQFQFPKFGDLPSSFISNGSMTKTAPNPPSRQQSFASQPSPNPASAASRHNSSGSVPNGTSVSHSSPVQESDSSFVSNNVSFANNDFSDLTALFSPSVLDAARRSNSTDYMSAGSVNSPSPGAVTNSSTTAKPQRNAASSMASPISSMSQNGLDSSSGTTPESYCESPDHRKLSETPLNTINEEINGQIKPDVSNGLIQFPSADANGIDWMAQQNGGQFDPVLFGDYRDPQENVLNNTNTTFGDFFNDAFPSPQDFDTPYNASENLESPEAQKPSPVPQVDTNLNTNPNFIVEGQANQYLTYQKLWERVQTSPNGQSGEHDMDELCTQLKAKARCSGTKGTAVIAEKDIEEVLGKQKVDTEECLKMFSGKP